MSARSQKIAAQLTQAVLSRRLSPGTKLGERELSEIFDVSRVVIRQALIRLSDAGLVVIERNRGAFVAKPSLADAIAVYDALTLIEQGVVAQLINRLSPASEAMLRNLPVKQRLASAEGNPDLASEHGVNFHILLVQLSGNHILEEIHGMLYRRARLFTALYRSEFDFCQLSEDHDMLIEMILRGQLRKAQKLIEEHHRLVVSSYKIEEERRRSPTLAELLAGDAEAAASANAPAPGRAPRKKRRRAVPRN